MKTVSVSHYCQKCLAANPLGQEFCARCGTRLMIIVEPPATRYEMTDSAVSNEEHLLERISGLENRQARLAEKLERALDLLLRQAQNSHFDRALVKALAGLLTDDGVIDNDRLERLWIDRCQKEAEEQQESERREVLRLSILANYRGKERAAFEQRVEEGFLLIEDEQLGRGVRVLQRAADLGPNNSPLISFLGEHFFKQGKTAKARTYLSRALDVSPEDTRVLLLLGLACADDGDTERAKVLLGSATQLGTSAFAAHFGLGRLLMAEKLWSEAIREFKLALASKASPEVHYALGCLYFEIGRNSLATRHLRKAVEIDTDYHVAQHLLGLTYERAGQKARAMECFQKAGTGSFVAAPNSTRLKRAHSVAGGNVGTTFRMSLSRSRKLITRGDRRLSEALREDALSIGRAVVDRGD